ncbi:MAG: hypothetical protein AAFR58_14630 [Cyanobacteria bacterium J06627_28]
MSQFAPQLLPKFATSLARAKVEKLMQPALIRVIDNIRKQLDGSPWQGTYEEQLLWPDGTTPEQKQEYAALQKVLHGVPPEEHDRVANLMSALPQPSPLYTLRLQQANKEDTTVDIWQLCYQVCALTYEPAAEIEADDGLFDDSGEVDWRVLDDKTSELVAAIFSRLPR